MTKYKKPTYIIIQEAITKILTEELLEIETR